MKLLVFDNYDSFTYNLVHIVEDILDARVDVVRNDEITLDSIENYDRIILSPGPGIPSEAGLLLPLIKRFAASKSILGVCLGHQAIAESFGGTLTNLETVYHGVATPIEVLPGEKIFDGLPARIDVGRYHSWIVDESSLPHELLITSRDENNLIMSLRHRELDITGVQFHPESVLTPEGVSIIKNWLKN